MTIRDEVHCQICLRSDGTHNQEAHAKSGMEPSAVEPCQKTWADGDKAYGCVLPKGHAGDHSPYATTSNELPDAATREQLWKDPDWECPQCRTVNKAIRNRCRSCGHDGGEFSVDTQSLDAEEKRRVQRRDGHSALRAANGELEKFDPHPAPERETSQSRTSYENLVLSLMAIAKQAGELAEDLKRSAESAPSLPAPLGQDGK